MAGSLWPIASEGIAAAVAMTIQVHHALAQLRVQGILPVHPEEGSLDLQARLLTVDERPPGRHVIRVEVTDPQGRPRREYARNCLAENGELEETIGLGLDPLPGEWRVELWDVASGQELHTLRQGNGLYGVAFSPDGGLVASAGCDRTVKLWDAASGKLLRTLPHADEVLTVAFSPDATLLASGGYDDQIYLWGLPR